MRNSTNESLYSVAEQGLLSFHASVANQSLAWMRVARVRKSLTPATS
jgi:hypothetical protein